MESQQEKHRSRAALARRLAKATTNPQVREQLEMAAQEYEEMAADLLNRPEHDDRGNRREQSRSARHAAEALFSPAHIEPRLREAAPASVAVHRPRILAAAATGPQPATPTPAKPAKRTVIPAEDVPRIRVWLKYGMTAGQVGEIYWVAAGEVVRALRLAYN